MTVQRRGDFPLHELTHFLETEGWDVSIGDALTADRTDAHGVFRLKIDRGGRAYLRRTFPARSYGRTVSIDSKAYATNVESTTVREVATTLDDAEEFPRVFEKMMELVFADTD